MCITEADNKKHQRQDANNPLIDLDRVLCRESTS